MLVENRDDVVILAPQHRVDTNTSPEVEKVVFENMDSMYLLLGLSIVLILVVLIFKKIFSSRT